MTESVEVLLHGAEAPRYAHPGDAGADLLSTESLVLAPGERALVGTGVSIALPDGFVAFVVPRSGLATTHGITIVNSPGTVDAGYRGEIRVTLLNNYSSEPYSVQEGDRIAQLVIMPVERLPGTERGAGGFGSTGYRSGTDSHSTDSHSPGSHSPDSHSTDAPPTGASA